jgi:hypothetical protein
MMSACYGAFDFRYVRQVPMKGHSTWIRDLRTSAKTNPNVTSCTILQQLIPVITQLRPSQQKTSPDCNQGLFILRLLRRATAPSLMWALTLKLLRRRSLYPWSLRLYIWTISFCANQNMINRASGRGETVLEVLHEVANGAGDFAIFMG